MLTQSFGAASLLEQATLSWSGMNGCGRADACMVMGIRALFVKRDSTGYRVNEGCRLCEVELCSDNGVSSKSIHQRENVF